MNNRKIYMMLRDQISTIRHCVGCCKLMFLSTRCFKNNITVGKIYLQQGEVFGSFQWLPQLLSDKTISYIIYVW